MNNAEIVSGVVSGMLMIQERNKTSLKSLFVELASFHDWIVAHGFISTEEYYGILVAEIVKEGNDE